MSLPIQWLSGDSLPPHAHMLCAVPGVGNVGKLVVDTLIEHGESTLLARILSPDLPPHATLEDGLLVPPHLALHLIESPAGPLVTLSGAGQPMTPGGQHALAACVLDLASQTEGFVLVLAGLSSEPGDDSVHFTVASPEVGASLPVETSAEQPAGGMLGLAGMLVSLGPWKEVPTVACIAASIGTSVDVQSADRLAKAVSDGFDLGLDLPIDNTAEQATALLARMEGREVAGFSLSEEDEGAGFYA